MKVLLVNTSERTGGAAVAASRLMEALKGHGIKARLLVRDKQTESISVMTPESSKLLQKWAFLRERLAIWTANRFKKKNLFAVDIANAGTDITRLPEFQQADLIHLHWINQGMLSLKEIGRILASGKPVVWTMHDMWPCTGICHHARECTNYRTACHHCPYLEGSGKKDLSYRTFRRKLELYRGNRIHFVACSHWLEELARTSALLQGQPVTSIPNPIDIHTFCPRNREEARTRCRLPQGGKLMLFGSVKVTDKRKGIDYLVEACRLLDAARPGLKERPGIVVFGHRSAELEQLLPFRVHALDYIADEHRLADLYNAVDLYVTPSLEENLPNTIMEAMACGTPCVGFRIGGIPEMIDHLENGYVAQYRSAEDLAKGIRYVLENEDYDNLSRQAHHKAASRYAEDTVARQYIELYQQAAGRNA